MLKIRDFVREGELIELPVDDTVAIARSVFRHCSIVGRTAGSHLTVVDSTFEDCDVHWKTVLRHKAWLSTRFIRCTFRGVYIGNRFGRRRAEPKENGEVVDCDFSGARLDGTDFLDCDVAALKLPVWPHFTFIEAPSHRDELMQAAEGLPKELKSIVQTSASAVVETSAVTWSATLLAKRSGLSEVTIRELLESIPHVTH